MSRRFFVETLVTGDSSTLTGPEAHHLSKVMRARVGDEVTLFDGSGAEFSASVAEIERSLVRLQIIARHEISRELPCPLTMGVALPKGERQRWLVEKLTELGVTRLVPLITARGVAQPEPNALVRLRRSVIEASKQCGRNLLMDIAAPGDVQAFVTSAPTESRCLFLHPQAAEGKSPGLTATSPVFVSVGPEGGFDDHEISLARQHHWQPWDLGPRILRVETAAVAVAAALTFGVR